MKTKLIALMLLAGGSAFAESHWSISIGGYAPGYYYPPPPAPYLAYQRQDLHEDYRVMRIRLNFRAVTSEHAANRAAYRVF